MFRFDMRNRIEVLDEGKNVRNSLIQLTGTSLEVSGYHTLVQRRIYRILNTRIKRDGRDDII